MTGSARRSRWRIVIRPNSRCCFWIWMPSSISTFPWDIRSATNFFNPSQRRLVTCLRRSDTVSRQGDEFVALLSEVRQPEDAAIAARKMLRAVAQVHSIDQHDLRVTASIGVSVYPEDGVDAEMLLKNAATAMYEAKESGCRCYRFFKRAVNGRAVRRQAIEEDLRLALERHQFALHYQPKINLKTGAITGAEALLRWMHPTGRLISRSEFIPIAEDCGLILPIGAWVLREACGQARAFADAGRPATTMAVNVSATEFRNENFLEGVFTILGETGLDPGLLELELTESVLMKHAESGASVLQTLREKGSAGGGRQLRHGLFEARLSAKIPGRCPQNRPVVHPSDKHRRRGCRHCERGDRHGPQSQSAGRRRGCGNAAAAGISSGSRMRRGTRTLFQPAGACRAIREVARNGDTGSLCPASSAARDVVGEAGLATTARRAT